MFHWLLFRKDDNNVVRVTRLHRDYFILTVTCFLTLQTKQQSGDVIEFHLCKGMRLNYPGNRRLGDVGGVTEVIFHTINPHLVLKLQAQLVRERPSSV